MAHSNAFDVSVKVLAAEGEDLGRDLGVPSRVAAMGALQRVVLDLPAFRTALGSATASLLEAAQTQHRAKAAYAAATRAARDVAKEGFRWVQRVYTRARLYLRDHEDKDLLARLRHRALRVPRCGGVINEMHYLLGELPLLENRLAGVGVDDAFAAEGQEILGRLVERKSRADQARNGRKQATGQLREAESQLSALLQRWRVTENAAALEDPVLVPRGLPAIAADVGRVRAQRPKRPRKRPAAPPKSPRERPGPGGGPVTGWSVVVTGWSGTVTGWSGTVTGWSGAVTGWSGAVTGWSGIVPGTQAPRACSTRASSWA